MLKRKRKKLKQILSILLAVVMMLSILPVVTLPVFAADEVADYGIRYDSQTQKFVYNGGANNGSEFANTTGFEWNSESNTLTLTNFNLTCNAFSALYIQDDMKIELVGDNVLINTRNSSRGNTAYGLVISNVTISDTGSLTAISNAGSDSYGISVGGSLSIESGTLIGQGLNKALGCNTPLGGITVKGGNDDIIDYTLYFQNGSSGWNLYESDTDIVYTGNDGKWSVDDNTLTLNGLDFTTSAATAISMAADTIIVLADNSANTITSEYNENSDNTYGIYYMGSSTIMGGVVGNGTLTVTSGTTTGSGKSSSGIRVGGTFTVVGGRVNVYGGESNYGSYGISSPASAVIISGGSINACGGTSGGDSYGINCAGARSTLTLSGNAKVTTSGGNSSAVSYGVAIYPALTLSDNAELVATGATSTNNSSYGVKASNNVMLSGEAKIVATGGTASTDNNSYGFHHNTQSYIVTINDNASITATGGTVSGSGKSVGAYFGAAPSITAKGGVSNLDSNTLTYSETNKWFYDTEYENENIPAAYVAATKYIGPSITIGTQPSSPETMTYGNISGSLTVEGTASDSSNVSYQWYKNTTNSNTSGTLVSGATSTSYTIPTNLDAGAYYYYCVLNAMGCTEVKSNVASEPTYTYSVTGLVSPDTKDTVITTVPTMSVASFDSATPTTFDIAIIGGETTNTNYNIAIRTNGTLTVSNKTDVSNLITFNNDTKNYNGSAQAITEATITEQSEGTWTYTYVGKNDTVYEASNIAPTNTGTYEVTADYESDTTFGTKTVSLTGFKKGKTATHVKVPATVTYKGVTYKVTAVAARAFKDNKKITKVTIANNVTEIGNLAFYKCTKLKQITIGTGIKKIGNHVFCHDKALKKMTITGKKLSSVGAHTLHNVTNLKISVPKAKMKAYSKMFKKTKPGKNMKIVKL